MEKLDPFAKTEASIEGVRVIIQPIDRKNGIMGVQIVGSSPTGEDTVAAVEKLRTTFGADVEMPDHPGTSHLRLAQIKTTLTPRELIKKLTD